MDDVLIRISTALFLLLAASGAFAQRATADPMRPPVGIAADPATSADGKELQTSLVLQSVVIPAKGKPIAIIGGQQVRLGEKIGENRLVRLNEREAVLDGPGGVELLALTPLVEKSNDNQRDKNGNASAGKIVQRGGIR